tara:strand:+ start:165 stop:1430 length:1266 start_codon:yes stop_codon:yes gene_type:complete
MKKVLIISYYLNPSLFVGGERAYSWYNYLHENGYYPIIITRNWNLNQIDETKESLNKKIEITKTDKGEIHRIPYHSSFRDKLSKRKDFLSSFLRKIITFSELLTVYFSQYKAIYQYSNEYLKNNEDCRLLIISGRPFYSFRFGYLFKKKFFDLDWVADYRDEWSTMSNNFRFFSLQKLIWFLDRKYEIKWVKSASVFISTSNKIINRIENITLKKGGLVLNGFDSIEYTIPEKSSNNQLTFLYSGTLYNNQTIDLIINLVKKINLTLNEFKIKFYFIGIDVIQSEYQKALDLINNDDNFIVLKRMPKNQLIEFYKKTDCFFLTPYKNNVCLPVKIFDYASYGKKILLYPSDNDLMDIFLKETKSGISSDNEYDCEKIIRRLISEKNETGIVKNTTNFDSIQKYSRKNQAKELSFILNNIQN